jgi:hypothetical protein
MPSLACDRPFIENNSADTSSARPSMVDISAVRREARGASGGGWGGVRARCQEMGGVLDAWRGSEGMVTVCPLRGPPSSSWRASLCLCWRPCLGRLRAKFGHGSKGKVEARMMLYDFHLGAKVTSVPNWEITKPKVDSVNNLLGLS